MVFCAAACLHASPKMRPKMIEVRNYSTILFFMHTLLRNFNFAAFCVHSNMFTLHTLGLYALFCICIYSILLFFMHSLIWNFKFVASSAICCNLLYVCILKFLIYMKCR